MLRRIATALLALSGPAAAENDCGRMVVNAIRIDGRIEAIVPLAEERQPVIDVGETDPRLVVRLRPMPSAGKVWTPAPLREAVLRIAVHSATRSRVVPGPARTQFLAMSCDGTFRRFIGFDPVPEQPVDFAGELEEGRLYRTAVEFEDGVLRTLVALDPPMHHWVGIEWKNLDEFPELRQATGARIVFMVESRVTEQREARQWWTSWNARILRVEPATRR